MFWIMIFFGWRLANTLDKIGDELIAMGSVEPEPVGVEPNIPEESGLWVDPEEVFGLCYRRN